MVHRLGHEAVELHDAPLEDPPGTSSTPFGARRGVISFQIHSRTSRPRRSPARSGGTAATVRLLGSARKPVGVHPVRPHDRLKEAPRRGTQATRRRNPPAAARAPQRVPGSTVKAITPKHEVATRPPRRRPARSPAARRAGSRHRAPERTFAAVGAKRIDHVGDKQLLRVNVMPKASQRAWSKTCRTPSLRKLAASLVKPRACSPRRDRGDQAAPPCGLDLPGPSPGRSRPPTVARRPRTRRRPGPARWRPADPRDRHRRPRRRLSRDHHAVTQAPRFGVQIDARDKPPVLDWIQLLARPTIRPSRSPRSVDGVPRHPASTSPSALLTCRVRSTVGQAARHLRGHKTLTHRG